MPVSRHGFIERVDHVFFWKSQIFFQIKKSAIWIKYATGSSTCNEIFIALLNAVIDFFYGILIYW